MKIHRKYWRTFLLTFIIFNFLLFILINYYNNFYLKYKFYHDNYLSLNIDDGQYSKNNVQIEHEQLCHLPIDQYGPYDKSILKYLQSRPKKVECPKKFIPVTYITDDGWLKQNDDYKSMKCYYQFFHKNPKKDSNPIFDKKKVLDAKKGLKLILKENYIFVKCCCHPNFGHYENLHFWFNPNNESHVDQSNSDKYNVFIMVIESLSRLNYLRYLNKTKNILENEYGDIYYLRGLNKIADNSFPNMVPLLTGKRAYKGELYNESSGPYDDWPLIWKRYKQLNYQTALIEDYPGLALFNYLAKGFIKEPPTDFYPRPLWIHLYNHNIGSKKIMKPFLMNPCYNERTPKIEIFLNQVEHFIRQCHDKRLPYFIYSFFIEITHDDFNAAQIIDSHLYDFYNRTKSILLNNTILILMGDHGNRFGSVLETQIGRIEERMPLFSIRLPKSLQQKYPNLTKNLEINKNRLATWLDVHQMLNDIIDDDFTSIFNSNNTDNRTHYSPWREIIPLERNCQTALIPDLYCTCESHKFINPNSSLIKEASNSLVNYINEHLIDAKICHKLSLNQTRSSELILPNSSTINQHNYRQQIEITISVEPSKGLFRSRLYRTAENPDKWIVESGQITRINKYGEQSHCVNERNFKPFCYCYQQKN